jgi:3-hydroxyacyl-CoA dehydrogenase
MEKRIDDGIFNRPMMKLIEVIRIKDTSQETYEAFLGFATQVKKQAVSCKDTPG